MKLIIDKPVKGIRNRGKPDEQTILYASPGDKLNVVFNNTENKEGKITGHYVCVPQKEHVEDIIKQRLQFIVFPSQVFTIIDGEKTTSRRRGFTYYRLDEKNRIEHDPFSTLLSGDEDESLL